MNELYSILDAWPDAAGAVLATVVDVAGSAYRRPGARMLLFPDGSRIGSISGGCLESDLCRKAWWLTEERAAVRVYDTTSDDDAVWEFGLGCNGVVHVLLERAASDGAAEAMRFIGRLRNSGAEGAVATVVRGASGIEPGDRLLVAAGTVAGGAIASTRLRGDVWRECTLAVAERRNHHAEIEGCRVLVEWIGPPQHLVIFGAGHDAIPVAAIAKQLGWRVTVGDGRPAYARRERFPDADEVVLLPQPIEISSRAAVLFITHNYPFDLETLPSVLRAEPRYIGLLGPKKRAARLFDDLGIAMPDSVHAPVGLDIGADTPEAIALAIVGEIQAHLNGRAGGRLRLRTGPIHAREAPADDFAAYQPRAACASM